MSIEYVSVLEHPVRRLQDMILTAENLACCNVLIEEQNHASLLRANNLEPRNRVLLAGGTGTGKNALAEALATELALPLLFVRYHALIGSYLWESASRLERLFSRAQSRRCVLFFDEFDLINPISTTLKIELDRLPSHVIVVGAIRNWNLISSAIIRRFQLRIKLDVPTMEQCEEWMRRFEVRIGRALEESERDTVTGMITERLSTFADLEDFGDCLQRRRVLSHHADGS